MAEPQSSAQQQQQSEANQRKAQASTFDAGGEGAGQNQSLGEIRFMTRYTQINGDETRSFHVPGENDLGEFNYYFDHDMSGSPMRLQFLTMFRSTDDASIDPDRNSLQKAYVRFYGPRSEYILGDTLVNYSRLTFNQNIKGFSGAWRIGDNWKLSTTTGVFIDRWSSLYKDQPQFVDNTGTLFGCLPPPGYAGAFTPLNDPQCGRPYTSVVSGVRLERKLNKESALGLNFATSDDLESTRVTALAGTTPFPANNRVASADLKYAWKGFRLDTEYAYSFTNFDYRAATPGMQGDYGARLDASYRYKKLTLRTSFLRFQPNFASMNARQVQDLQDWLFRASYDLTNWLTADGTIRRSNDDLRRQLPFEQVVWGPEARLILHDLSFYRRGTFELGYRHRDVQASDGSVDHYVRIPYGEFTLPVKTTFLTIGYERREAVDNIVLGQTSNTSRYYAALRGIYDFNGWHVTPNFRYELERAGQRPSIDRFNTLTPGEVLNPLDLLDLYYDSNRLASAGIMVETPKYFIVELAFRDASSTTTNQTDFSQQCVAGNTPPCNPLVGTIAQVLPTPAGYSRPSYRAALTYKIANDENKMLIFAFERNNNFFYTQDFTPGGLLNPANFDERLIGVTFVYKFGRRGR